MCSLQSFSAGIYPSEQLEDEFITNLFSQNISSNNNCVQTEPIHAANSTHNVVQDAMWLSANQMDHDYVQTEASAILPAWEDQTTNKSSTSLNTSTYFSSFDPSVQIHPTSQLRSSNMQNKLISIQHSMGHIHRAQINMVPTATGHFKAIVKRKRKRTVFRTDQVEAMEKVFAKKPYVTKEDRKILVDTLHISDKSVKVWFQNRRLKNKRGEDQYNSEDENSSSSNLDRLDYVESKIHERTNELGYVTLDDKILDDLYKVIDEYLNKPRRYVATNDIEMVEAKVKKEFIPLYEPISPASNIDNSNEESPWKCQSPVGNEYLQRLIDIESIISN